MKGILTLAMLFITVWCSGLTMVKGRLTNQNNESLEFASVLLFSAKDSSLAKAAYTEQNGTYQLELSQPGNYFIKTNYLLNSRVFLASIQALNYSTS